jgi:hypothetical protein
MESLAKIEVNLDHPDEVLNMIDSVVTLVEANLMARKSNILALSKKIDF